MDRRRKFIKIIIEELNDNCSDLHQHLMDEDYAHAKVCLDQFKTKLKYIKETFIDEL